MKTPPRSALCALLAAAFVLAPCVPALAEFMGPEPAPVDRLLKSAENFLAKNPAKPEAHYTLARIHYLAFHLKRDHVPVLRFSDKEEALPRPAPQWMLGWTQPPKASQVLDEKALVEHASKALQGFTEAMRLDPKNGLCQLGIASLLEEFFTWRHERKRGEIPHPLNGITLADARKAYAKALTLSMVEDSKITHKPVSGMPSIVSHEAATALVRLAKNKDAELSAIDQADLDRAKKALDKFSSLKPGPITPIVFSFQAAAHLDELLAPKTTVDFDLRGYGVRERWPWVKPELGFLVWDPERTGVIRSARQLFGGYTFQIFRANGYDALAALDDNGDGVLTGAELDGISVWFDRNSDGVSSRDEVIPLRDLGIVSIATTMDGHDGIHPTNARGITLRDGRTLRTWDWIVQPLSEKSAPLISAAASRRLR